MNVATSLRLLLGLGLKAWRDSFVFRGRSTRTEFVGLWLVSMLLVAVGMIVNLLLDLDLRLDLTHAPDSALPRTILVLAVENLPFLPIFALMARRAHDFGWIGWPFSIAAAVLLSLGLWRDLHHRTTGIDLLPDWVEILRIVGLIAFYGVFLCEPSRRSNRYGPDPREKAQIASPA